MHECAREHARSGCGHIGVLTLAAPAAHPRARRAADCEGDSKCHRAVGKKCKKANWHCVDG